MAINTFVELDIAEARQLADLTGVVRDFTRTQDFARQLKELLTSDPPDYRFVEPLTTAILVRYSRPFAKGIRRWLGIEEIGTLPAELRGDHLRYRNWRDKHIAHSVNVFEENQPVARYWVERLDEEGFTSVECNAQEIVGLSAYDTDRIDKLCTHFIDLLKPKIKTEKTRVLKIVRSMPRERVLAMEKPASAPSVADAAKDRVQ